jgi:hypothetical protein
MLWNCHNTGLLDMNELCDKVCQWLSTGQWFSLVSSSNKTDRHEITEILLKMALISITQKQTKCSIFTYIVVIDRQQGILIMFTATPETEIDYIVTLQMYIYLPLYCMHLLVALDTAKTSNINPKDHLEMQF